MSTQNDRERTPHPPSWPMVLVADDDLDARRLMTLLLKRDGIAVVEAADGDALFHWMQIATKGSNSGFAAVITDLQMPGPPVLEVLRGFAPSPSPVIVVTAFSTDAKRREAYDLGAYMVLDKPYVPDDLRAATRAAITHWSKRFWRGP